MEPLYKREILALSDAGAKYVVVGALGLALHGYPRATFDLDLVPDLDPDNLERVVTALEDMGYKPTIPEDPRRMKDPAVREDWHRNKHMKVFGFATQDRRQFNVDVMINPPIPYSELAARSRVVDIDGRRVRIASLRDMYTMKTAADRVKDAQDIYILQQILGEAAEGRDKGETHE